MATSLERLQELICNNLDIMKCEMNLILAKLILLWKCELKTEFNSLLLAEVLVFFVRKMFENYSSNNSFENFVVKKNANSQEKSLLSEKASAEKQDALIDLSNGTKEVLKGSPDLAEALGDKISDVGLVTFQPEIMAVGEGISKIGSVANVVIDFAEGKSPVEILVEKAQVLL